MEETKNNEQPNSVEISINAKGQYSGKVKVYANTSEEAMEDAILKAKELDNLIRSKNKGDKLK